MCVAPWWQVLQEELQGRRQQVSSLQEVSAQLLLDAGGDAGLEAKEKVHVIATRLQLLLRRVQAQLSALQEVGCGQSQAAGSCTGPGPQASPAAARGPPPRRSLFWRALFPLQLLLLLLLLACLLSADGSSCTLANNFARSFYPMLRYTNGPPPT